MICVARLRTAVESNEAPVRFGKSRPYPVPGVAQVAALAPPVLLIDIALIAKRQAVIVAVFFFIRSSLHAISTTCIMWELSKFCKWVF